MYDFLIRSRTSSFVSSPIQKYYFLKVFFNDVKQKHHLNKLNIQGLNKNKLNGVSFQFEKNIISSYIRVSRHSVAETSKLCRA